MLSNVFTYESHNIIINLGIIIHILYMRTRECKSQYVV